MIKPHRDIGPGYMHRWYLIPRNRWFNIYLHHFLKSDDDRALHDHPWWSVSFLLKGRLTEYMEVEGEYPDFLAYRPLTTRQITRFRPVFRSAEFAHRIDLHPGDTAWTLFITGPVVRSWGFHCPNRWVPWREFTDDSGNGVGKGCE